MTTQLNGTEFVAVETRTFRPTFEGAQARREQAVVTLAVTAALTAHSKRY